MRAFLWLSLSLLCLQACARPDSLLPDGGWAEPDAGAQGGLDGGADAGTDAGASDCGPVGQLCDASTACPQGLTCYGNGAQRFCAPNLDSCGGIIGNVCPDFAPTCLYFAGADYGVCADDLTKKCACARSRGTFANCPIGP